MEIKIAVALTALVSVILLTSGCLYSRVNDRQEVSVIITGVQEYNQGYILIPAPIYGFGNEDLETADIVDKLAERDSWSVEEVRGIDYLNISLRYDIEVKEDIKDPSPAYFRGREFDTGSDLHSIEVYLHMEKDQDLTLELESLHSDDFHWFRSECTGFVSEGWNSLTVFYTLEES
jgi:hypothetical protein